MNILLILADAANTAAAAAGPSGSAPAPIPGWAQFIKSNEFLIPMVLAFVVLMTFMRGGKGKQDREREAQLKQLKRGDRVQTIGGVLGTVLRAEENRIEVKVDESSNTKIWFARSAIYRVVEAEKAEVK